MNELQDSIGNSLDKIDFGTLDEIARGLGSTDMGLFHGEGFGAKVVKILSGSFANDHQNVLSAILNLVGGVVADVLPLVVMVVGISILSGFIHSLRHETSGSGVRDIIHFVTYTAVVILVLYAVSDLVVTCGRTLNLLKTQMDIIFPIMLTLMSAIGGTVSVSVYQPAIVILSNGVMQIFTYIILPLFIVSLTFAVIGNLSANQRYDKFVGFFNSLYKWILGITFTVFIGFLSIQGIVAGAFDGISIRAVKFTVNSGVPIVGGYLSQGFDLIMASSTLIKNAIGVAGLYMMFALVLSPILKIASLSLGLKLASAVTQPLSDGRISSFLTSTAKSFSMLTAVLVGASFMYFITIGLIIMTGNFIS